MPKRLRPIEDFADEPSPLGAIYRAVIEVDIAGGTLPLVAAAVERFAEGLIGRVIDANQGDAIVIVGYASRDVDYSPTKITAEPDLTT